MGWRERRVGGALALWGAGLFGACAQFGAEEPATVPPENPLDASPDDGVVVDDTCRRETAVCPLPSSMTEGSGLRPIDRCAFSLRLEGTPLEANPLITKLEIRYASTLDDVVTKNLNRIALPTTSIPGTPPGVQEGFRWDNEDNSNEWIPRGIAISTVGSDRYVMASWNDSLGELGSRVTIVKLTPDTVDGGGAVYHYRRTVFAEVTGTEANPSWRPVPIHAGGLVWFGHFLYVSDAEGSSLRIFDINHIMEPNAEDETLFGCDQNGKCDAAKYLFVLPQVGIYRSDSNCRPIFSSIALDPSSEPPAIVSSEFCTANGSCPNANAGRVFHWPLDKVTGLLRGAPTYPTEAYFMGQSNVRGAVSYRGVHYLSAATIDGGALYRVTVEKSESTPWIDEPAAVAVDPEKGYLLGLSPKSGSRYVFGAALDSYPAPTP